jgi:hypothetical protein
MTFWYGSGSTDPCLWLMDPDLDPVIFIIDLQDAKKKTKKKEVFLPFTFWRYIHHFSKIKVKKKYGNKTVGIKVFLTIFAWLYKDPEQDLDLYIWLTDPVLDTYPPDPDPQHCLASVLFLHKKSISFTVINIVISVLCRARSWPLYPEQERRSPVLKRDSV